MIELRERPLLAGEAFPPIRESHASRRIFMQRGFAEVLPFGE